jgi:hypothetical protein
MSLKLHRDYVEPFLNVERKMESDAYQPMSLTKVTRSRSYGRALQRHE